MFGFSLTKLLVLAAIVGAVLVLFRLLGQRGVPKRAESRRGDAVDTEYDAESDTYVVRTKETREK